MGVRFKGLIELETPISLADMEQFVIQAKEMGISLSKQVTVTTQSGYSYAKLSASA